DEKRDPDAPFFLNIWFNEPHAVVAAPDELVSQYGALNDQAAIYSGTVANTDRAIGRLLAKLKKLGELDNTIIHYSSDNGSYRRDRVGKLRGSKGSHFEGGHRVPGIFYWKDGIPGGRVEEEPAGAVDLLPTICGLAGIDHPKQKPLDGSDLTPLLTRSGKFERHQPLFWMNGTTMALRMGDYTLLAPGTTKLPYDSVTINRLLNQTKAALGDDLEKELGGLDLRSRMFNGRFANPEADRLRNQFRAMFYFNEAAIPLMKKGSVNQVELYNLANDLSQETDISAEKPEIVARMKGQHHLSKCHGRWPGMAHTRGTGRREATSGKRTSTGCCRDIEFKDRGPLGSHRQESPSRRLSGKPPPALRRSHHGRAQTRTTRPGRPALERKAPPRS
ncbi:MAG TPA: hypothetical protein EYQ75_08590, partial [Planctomycetaceae bacterium]|nr:hypothetical protein [Planctomycetaceae bacterium]